jgi:triphosphoribosyl-dephospho-CoA synthetase
MNAALFLKSAEALEPYFAQAAWMGMSLNVSPEALFTLLRRWGKWAEREMYTATGDVNTHKGAIFTMGVFCAAIGRCVHDGNMDMESIRTLEQQMVSKQLQRELETLSQREAITYGEKNYCRYGSRGIRGAAINGYSEVFEEALPILKEGKRQNKDWNRVKLQVLITLMSRIEDSNIIARRDLPTLKAVQQNMRDFLAQGGAYQETAIEKLQRMDREFSRKNISGGGSADLLALTIFINRITEELETKA